MKKIRMFLFLLLVLTQTTHAALPTGTPPGCVQLPSYHGGLTFGIGLLLWQPITQNLDYALFFPQFDSTDDNAPIFEHGEYQIVEPSEGGNLTLNIGYVFPCTNKDVTVVMTRLTQHNDDTIDNPLPGFNLFATFPINVLTGSRSGGVSGANELTFFDPSFVFGDIGIVPNLTIPIPIDEARAKADFRDNIWDIEFGQSLHLGCRCKVRVLLGLRIADINQKLKATYTGTGAETGRIIQRFGGGFGVANFVGAAECQATQSSAFDGVGPRVGLNVNYHIGNGFGIVAESSGSVLLGDLESELRESIDYIVTGRVTLGTGIVGQVFTDNTQGRELTLSSTSNPQIAPNLDAKLALDYTYEVCYLFWSRVTAELGYRVNHYWNTASRIRGLGQMETGDSSAVFTLPANQLYDTSLAGPYFSLQIQL